MPNIMIENPKATIVAVTGLIIFVLKTYVFKDTFSPEIEAWLNVILPSVFWAFLGRYTRISKDQAKVLDRIDANESKNQL